ncbi:HYR domain-containing protein, partial [Aureisphaera sp.]
MKKLTQIFLCLMLVSTSFAQDFSSTTALDNPVMNQTLQSDANNSEFAPVTITQSNTQNFTQGGACNDGTILLDTKIARAFDLENDHAVNGNFTISSVEFGVFFFGGTTGPFDVVINLYSTPDPFPGGAMTLQATSTRTVSNADNLTLLSEPMSAVIPAGELLVYEIDLVSDGVNFPAILGNSDGGIAPTYIESTACGFPTYAPWPSAFGTVMNVVGEVIGDPPMITCPMDVTTTASPGICGAVVGFAPPLVVDPDGDLDTVEQTMGLPSGSEFPVGATIIEFTATDMEGASSTCTFTITVTDDEAPMAVCADITVALDGNGEYVLNAAEIDGGSTDNCGIASLDIGGNASITLTCAELGDNTITLTVTDDSGNTATCDATVTVIDDEAPVIMCEGDFQSQDIMVNGSFETGDLSDWTAIDNPNPFLAWGAYASNDGNGFFDPALPTDGAWLAGNGFDGESGEAVIYQDVSIDPAAVGATLTWDENIDYDLASFCAGCQDRIYEVQVRDLSDNVLEVLVQITATAGIIDNDNAWVSQTADLSAYAGQDIRIAYWQSIPDDFSGPAKFALDNVQLNVETLASAPFVVELDANGNATINVSDLVTVTDNCGATATVPGDLTCEEISNGSNAFENGYFSDPGSGFLVANDIVVPADEDFNLEQVTMNLFHDVGATIATADFTYYEDNAGQPGAEIGSEAGVAPSAQTVVGNNFGFDVSETVFDITPFLFAGQAGVQTNYWVSVSVTSTSGGITAWEVSGASGAGDYDCLNTADGGATWGNPVPGNDGVYIFSGNCTPGADTTIDFDCSNLGLNIIEVTVTDDSGNTATCNATVEVLDVTDPVLICQDVTIEIGPDGTTEIDPEDLLATAPSTFDAMV